MNFLTRTIRVEKGKELSEAELNAAFAVPLDDRLWRALHQLIDNAGACARERLAAWIPPGVLAGYVGWRWRKYCGFQITKPARMDAELIARK
jgi:hypothetical protein